MVKGLPQRSGLARFCACAESCVVFNTGPYTVLPDNSILNTANMQSETGFLSSHQLNSYAASKSRLKLAARAVLSADGGLLVKGRSTALQLLCIMDEWTTQLDSGGLVDDIYTDFAKAFDTVPHHRLLSKLKSYNINQRLLMWIQDFLCNRKQSIGVSFHLGLRY